MKRWSEIPPQMRGIVRELLDSFVRAHTEVEKRAGLPWPMLETWWAVRTELFDPKVYETPDCEHEKSWRYVDTFDSNSRIDVCTRCIAVRFNNATTWLGGRVLQVEPKPAEDQASAVDPLRQPPADAYEYRMPLTQDMLDAIAWTPVPMLLHCPECHERHIDGPEFPEPHHTHACQHCGHNWRPAVVRTVGVQFLPGFKNAEPPTAPQQAFECDMCRIWVTIAKDGDTHIDCPHVSRGCWRQIEVSEGRKVFKVLRGDR